MSKLKFVNRSFVLVCTCTVLGIGVVSIVPGLASDVPAQVALTTSTPGYGAALAGATDHDVRPVAWNDGDAVARQGCGVCDGWEDEGFWHVAYAHEDAIASKGAGWHPGTPAEGICPNKHPHDCAGCYCPLLCGGEPTCVEDCISECPPPSGGFAALLESVRSGSASPFDVAAAYVNVEINEERQALQVMGCDNTIIAHIPLRAIPAQEVGDEASATSPAGEEDR